MTFLPDAAPATRRVPLCFDADAEKEWLLARAAVKAGRDGADSRLAEAEQAAGAQTVVVTLRALTFPEVQRAIDDHPPRIVDDEFNRYDLQAGYNRATFKPALVHAAIDSPDLTGAQWSTLLHTMTRGQFNSLFEIVDAMASRRTPADLPFVSAASGPTQD